MSTQEVEAWRQVRQLQGELAALQAENEALRRAWASERQERNRQDSAAWRLAHENRALRARVGG